MIIKSKGENSMKANLIYKTDTENMLLKEDDLKKLDEETYNLKNPEGLKAKYHLENTAGNFLISYDANALPLETLYLYNFLDEDLETEKYLPVNFTTRPYLIDTKRDIYTLLDDFSTLKDFYESIKGNFSASENLYFTYGTAFDNKDLCAKVLDRFLTERLESTEAYFFARVIKEAILKAKEKEKTAKTTK